MQVIVVQLTLDFASLENFLCITFKNNLGYDKYYRQIVQLSERKMRMEQG